MERKCMQCGTWNLDNDFCIDCAAPVSPKEIQKVVATQKQQLKQSVPPGKLDAWILKIKNSTNPIIRALYKIMYSFWVAYMAVISFILWVVAWMSG